MADFAKMLNDPRMMQMVSRMAQQSGRPGGMQQGMKKPANPLSNLADAYPKLKSEAEQMKIEEQKRKLKKMQFDMLLKQAEQQYKLKEQQMQAEQGQAQIEAARRSV